MMAAYFGEGGYGAPASVIHADSAHADRIVVADAQLLFTAHFHRAGSDLVLTGRDGHSHIIPGYFSSEHPPALVAPNGAMLSPHLVDLLAGSASPNEYAQAGPITPPARSAASRRSSARSPSSATARPSRSMSATRSTKAMLSRLLPARPPVSPSPTAARSISSPIRAWR